MGIYKNIDDSIMHEIVDDINAGINHCRSCLKISETDICPECEEMRRVRQNRKCVEYRQSDAGKTASRKSTSKQRGLGSIEINDRRFGCEDFHHPYLEDDVSFGFNIPDFLHECVTHNSFNGKNMTRINSIGIQYWLDEEIYDE